MERLPNAKHMKGDDVAEIKWILKNTNYTSLQSIAEQYKCSATMIARIRDEKSWKRIEPKEPK